MYNPKLHIKGCVRACVLSWKKFLSFALMLYSKHNNLFPALQKVAARSCQDCVVVVSGTPQVSGFTILCHSIEHGGISPSGNLQFYTDRMNNFGFHSFFSTLTSINNSFSFT